MSLTGMSVTEVLQSHVELEVESIDRMYLNVFVPGLQVVGNAVNFFRKHRGETMVTMKMMSKMTVAYRERVDQYVVRHDIPVVRFEKNQRKDDVTKAMLQTFSRTEGVLFLGVAQEKSSAMRTIPREARNGKKYPWVVKSSVFVNHYYFYCVDRDFGPFFLKFCSYFPYNAKLCINGHEYVKRQLQARGIAYEALDNGILSCSDPEVLQQICDQLGEAELQRLAAKWLSRLPNPFTEADRKAGYRYTLSVLQIELSLTQVLDQPVHGRMFFEDVIRENIDLGRPENVQLIFNRRIHRNNSTRFRTRVITEGVIPSVHVYYKKARVKQYFKEGRALRTETTINDTYDFGIGRNLSNLPALRSTGFSANRRLLDVQKISHDCMIGEQSFQDLARPMVINGQRVPALPFHDTRIQALASVLVIFSLQLDGFRSKQFRELLAPLLGIDPAQLSSGRVSYDLRRLRLRGLIERIPSTHRYRVTVEGLRVALFYARVHARIIRPGLSQLIRMPASHSKLTKAFSNLVNEIDHLCETAKLAA